MKVNIMSKDMSFCPKMGNDSYYGAASNCIASLKQLLSAMPIVIAEFDSFRLKFKIFPSLIVGTEAETGNASLAAKDLAISMICDQSRYNSSQVKLSGSVGTCLY